MWFYFQKSIMSNLKFLFVLLTLGYSSSAFAQNFAESTKMISYESKRDGTTSLVEFSYYYHDMYESILELKLLQPTSPAKIAGNILVASLHAAESDNESEWLPILNQLGIHNPQAVIPKEGMQYGKQCYYKGKANIEIIELQLFENSYDADVNNASISTASDIELVEKTTFKCDGNVEL